MTPAQKKMAIFAAIIATIIIVLILFVKVAKIPVFAMAMALTAKKSTSSNSTSSKSTSSNSTSSNSTSSNSTSSKQNCISDPSVVTRLAELVGNTAKNLDAAIKEEERLKMEYAISMQAAAQYAISDPNRYGIMMNDAAKKYVPAIENASITTAVAKNHLIDYQRSYQKSKNNLCG